jgi:Tfp pilus assembly protein PilO
MTIWLVTLAVLVAWAGYVTLWMPKIKSIIALNGELEYAQEAISEGQQAVAELGNWNQGLRELFDREMEYVSTLMPDKDDMPGLGVLLVALAEEHGVGDLTFDIRPRELMEAGEAPDTHVEWYKLPLKIEVSGKYAQLVEFAVGLERMERLIVVDEVHFEREERIAPRVMCTISGFAPVQERWRLEGEEFASRE